MTNKEFQDNISFLLLCGYVALAPFGTLFRFSNSETSLGISSIILICLITINLKRIIPLFLKSKIFILLSFLIFWISIVNVYSQEIYTGYIHLVCLLIYILFSASITRIYFSLYRLKIIFILLAVSMLLSAFITLIDFWNIINIQFVNKLHIVTKITGESVYQVSGFFLRRSAMAAYFSIILPAFFILFITLNNSLLKSLFIFSFFISFIVLIFTHNLAGVVSIILTCMLYIFFGYQVKFLKKISKIASVALTVTFFTTIITTEFPEVVEVYLVRIGVHYSVPDVSIPSKELTKQIESDDERIYLFKQTIASLAQNPFGHGLSQLTDEYYGNVDPHNILSQFIWSSGIFFFFWVGLFAYTVIKVLRVRPGYMKNGLKPYFDAAKFGLLSWLICGMAHNIIFTGLAWAFLGLALNIRYQSLATSNRNHFWDTVGNVEK